MQTFRLENFIAAPSNLRKREVTTFEVRYNPRNAKQVRRIRTMRNRAEDLGVNFIVGRDGDMLKATMYGYKGSVKRVLHPEYRSSTRRSSQKKTSSTRRRSQRGGGLFDFWKKGSTATAEAPVAGDASAKRGIFSTLFGLGKTPAAAPAAAPAAVPADDVPEPVSEPAPSISLADATAPATNGSVGGARRTRRRRSHRRHQSRRR